jgi:hypothetical protein
MCCFKSCTQTTCESVGVYNGPTPHKASTESGFTQGTWEKVAIIAQQSSTPTDSVLTHLHMLQPYNVLAVLEKFHDTDLPLEVLLDLGVLLEKALADGLHGDLLSPVLRPRETATN